MTPLFTIAGREVRSFFSSPIAYIVLTSWMFFHGLSLWFIAQVYAFSAYELGSVSDTPLTRFFGGTVLFYLAMLVVVPLMTMRLIAEEERTGTLEALLTTPVTEAEVILGKYLAALCFWVALWMPTVLFCYLLQSYGSVDWGVVGACYLGVFGLGLLFMALGLLMSTVAKSQIAAGVLTFFAVGCLFLLGFGAYVFDGPTQEAFRYISVWSHMEDFAKGIVDSRHLVFDLTIATVAVVAAIRTLESRRFTR